MKKCEIHRTLFCCEYFPTKSTCVLTPVECGCNQPPLKINEWRNTSAWDIEWTLAHGDGGIAASVCSLLTVKCIQLKAVKGPIHESRSKNPSIFWSKKFKSKFWLDFWPCVGDFFVKKYIDSKYWLIKSVWYILTSRQYFDNSSIFWRMCGLLSKFWSKIQCEFQSSGEHLIKTRAMATAASGSNIFNTMNFDQNFDRTCNLCGQYGVKNLIKNWKSLFCFKILTFLIVYCVPGPMGQTGS